MVAVVTGSGLGLGTSSLATLGAGGSLGNAGNGRGGDRLYVNSITGNLIVQRSDDFLLLPGASDFAFLSTYNSQGLLANSFDNQDTWQFSAHKRVYNLTGTVNTAGSTITRVDGDGAEVAYSYDAGRSRYIATAGAGAHDSLTYNSGNQRWTWASDSGEVTETYYALSGTGATPAGRICEQTDPNGQLLTYTYDTSGKLTTITNVASGESLALVYVSGTSNVQEVRASVRAADGTLQTVTRVRYTYVGNRLESIRTDLSPNDNAVADGNVYTTTFAYNANGLVSSIAQSDGSSVSFTYVNLAALWRVQTVTVNDGATNRVTTFSYDTTTRITTITDPAGQATTFEYDTSQRLVRMGAPQSDGIVQEVLYGYDSSGNVTSVTDGRGQLTTLEYDARGNLTLQRDSMGNTVTRIYNTSSGTESARNLLLSETRYATPDPDGPGAGTASGALVTRYIYDANNNLRFEVTNEGRVTEHLYSGTNPDVTLNAGRLRIATVEYTETRYTVPGSATATITLASMNTWRAAAGTNRSAVQRTDYAYEPASSRLARATLFARVDASGNGVVDGTESVQQFVYDGFGKLLQTIDANGHTTLHTYDGLGRLLTTTQRASGQGSGGTPVAVNVYDDAGARVVTTLANGLVTTSTYNRAGLLLSVANTGPGAQVLGTTTYVYDAAGRLRMSVDPTGLRTHRLYDVKGRLVAEIDGDGTLLENVYDKNNRLIKSIEYALRVDPATLVDGSGNPTHPTLASLRTVANADPARNLITRVVYDNSGRVAFTVEADGALTEVRHDGASRVTDTLRYANRITIAPASDEVLPSAAAALIVTSGDDRRTRLFYDLDGRPLATLDAEGYLVENFYDGAGQLVRALAYAGVTPAAERAAGALAALRPALDAARDRTTWFFYDGQGRRTGELDAEGYLTENVFDRNGNVAQTIRYPGVRTYTGTPTLAGVRPASTAGAQSATAVYDEFDRVVQLTNFEGTVTAHSYDAAGKLVATTRAQGVVAEARTTEARYDALGRITAELSAEGRALIVAGMTQTAIDAIWAQHAVTHSYDLAGRRRATTDALGNRTLFYYDTDGRLTHTVNALGEVNELRYDALNRVTDRIAYANRIAAGNLPALTGGFVTIGFVAAIAPDATRDSRTTLTYTLAGRVASEATAEGGSVTHAYNAFGEEIVRLEQVDASRQLEHRYGYNARGLLVQTRWDPTALNSTETREYDAFGRLTRFTDTRSGVSTVEYDRLGRSIARTDALNLRRTTTYDAFSRLLTSTDALNNTTSYSYNDTTRAMTTTTPEGVAVTTVRNRHGETVTVTDGRGNSTSYLYDRNGRVTSVSDGQGAIETRAYDRAGRQVTSTDARGTITSFAYDAAARSLTRTVDTGGLALQTRYAYDTRGRVVEFYDENNALTATEYDRDGRVTAVTVDPSGPARSRTTYVYDKAGNEITVTEGAGSANPRVTQYQYDVLGRRTQEVVDPGAGKLNLTTHYRYDANGNLRRRIDANGNSTWYVHDIDNRLRFTIDALGGVSESVYDAEDRVVETRRYATPVAVGGFGDVVTIAQLSLTATTADGRELRVYDRDGREAYTIDALGGTTRREFDANGNVVRQVMFSERIGIPANVTLASVQAALAAASDGNSANDMEMRGVFDSRDRMAFAIDGLGAVVRNEYDAAGNVVARTGFATLRTTAGVPDLATMQSWVSSNSVAARDRVERSWYDAAGRLVFTLDAEGYLREQAHDGVGRARVDIIYAAKPAIAANATLAQARIATDAIANAANDQRTTLDYDAGGRVTRVTDAMGRIETYGYDALGNRTSLTNARNATWTYEYDANSRLIYERTPNVAVTSVTESGATLVSATNASVSLVTFTEYDALGNVRRRTEALGTSQARTTEYQYDVLGRQTRTIFPQVGVYSAPAGDELRAGTNVVRAETPQTLASETAYDTLGHAFRNRDVAGNYTYRAYDALGRVAWEIDAENFATAYAYDAFGNRTQLTRYANRLTSALPTTSAGLTASADIVPRLAPNATQDRSIASEYDRLGRITRVIQPAALNFAPSAGSAGGQSFTAGATTVSEYNAFGQVIRQRELVNPSGNVYADTYLYYDRRGNKTAEVDPLGYLSLYEYDASGDLTRQVEYARPVAAGWTTSSYGTPLVTTPGGSPGHLAGYDREARFAYDQLDRKISQTRYNVEYATVSGSTTTTAIGNPTTTFGYDEVGNQTRVSDHSGATTYTYYDVLGRTRAITEPVRDRGDSNSLRPLVVMGRDAFGNLVQELRYANGAASADAEGFTPAAAATGPSGDRLTLLRVDSHGNVVQVQDATGRQRHASYDARGEIAKEWQPVTDADGVLEVLVTIHQYDKLGRRVAMIEPQKLGTVNVVVTTQSEYNAFGEITRRGTDNGWQEYFEYDKAGRVWRSNGNDGVVRVYLYDLAGRVTAEIRSKELDLKAAAYVDAASVAALTTQRMRTETRYDLRGSIVEQRLPTFGVSNGLEPILASFQIGAVSAPNNPNAIYQRVDLGFFGGVQYHVNPLATVAQGGGYFLNPNGTYTLDPYHQVASATRIHWAAPTTAGVNAYFEYRVQGSGSTWTVIPVAQLPANELGVNVNGLANLSNTVYEYRLTYSRAPENLVFAEATGTFRVDGTNNVSITVNQTPADPAAEVANLATTHGNNTLVWAAPADTTVTAVLRVKLTTSSTFVTYNATRSGGNFQVTPGLLGTAGTYDYEIEYARAGSVIAKKAGQLTSNGTGTLRTASGTLTETNIVTTVDVVGTLTGSVNGVVGATIASTEYSQLSGGPGGQHTWPGQNVVNLQWASIGTGQVRVELDYVSQGHEYWYYNPQDVAWETAWEPGIAVNNRQFTFASGASGVSVVWDTNAGAVGGGIAQVNAVRVYKETSPGVWTLQYTQSNPTPVHGKALTWMAPSAAVVASFEYKLQGSGTWSTLTVNQGPTLFGVELNSLAAAVYDYRITYRIGNRITAQQTGVVTIANATSGTVTTATVTAGSAPAAPETVATVTGQVGASVSGSIASSQYQDVDWGNYTTLWYGTNSVNVSWSNVGSVPIKVELDYVTQTRQFFRNLRDEGYVLNEMPGQQVNAKAFTFASGAATGAALNWTDASLFRGIASITGIRVYTTDAQGNYTVLLRSTALPATPTLAWAAPAASTTVTFGYRVAGSGAAWTNRTATRNGASMVVDVSGIANGSYEYYIGYRRSGDTFDASGATGTFSISGASVSASGQAGFNNAPGWISGVSHSGSNVTWSQAPNAGASVTFEYLVGGTWTARTASTANGTNYTVSMVSVPNGTYSYRILYTASGQSLPYLQATGTVVANTSTSGTPASVTVTSPSNLTFPATRITPIALTADRISWNYAALAGSTVSVQYSIGGVGTFTKNAEGTGPAYGMTFSEATPGTRNIVYDIRYFRAGETDPYARAHGTVTLTVTNTPIPPTITITSQTAVYPSGLQQIAAPTDNGNNLLGWTTAAEAGATVTFRAWSAGGTPQTLAWTPNGSGYRVNVSSLPPGVFNYEIAYVRAGQTNPYARAVGTFTIARTTNITGSTLTDTTATTQTPVTVAPAVSQSVDRWGSSLSVTDAMGQTTNYRYNQFNQLIEVKLPQVTIASTTGGIVTQTLRPMTTNYFDILGRAIATRDGNGNLNKVTLNAAGQIIVETHADSGQRRFTYDAFGNQVEIANELGFRTRNTYNGANLLTQVSREVVSNGFVTQGPNHVVADAYGYDGAGRRITESNGENETTKYFYDLHGNLRQRRTPLGRNTTYEYNAQGKRTREQNPLSHAMTWTYDYFGRMLTHVDLGSYTTTWTYDFAGLATTQNSTAGQRLTFTTDEAGRLKRVVDVANATQAAAAGLQVSNRTTDYGYDIAGRRNREKTVIDGRTHQDERTEYDASGRISKLTDLRYTLTYTYDAQGNRTRTVSTYFDHQQIQRTQDLWYKYDAMNRVLVSQGANVGNAVATTTAQGISLTYDLAGQRSSATTFGSQLIVYEEYETWNPGMGEWVINSQWVLASGYYTDGYSYDGLGRLATMTRSGENRYAWGGGGGGGYTEATTHVIGTHVYDKASREISDVSWTMDSGSGGGHLGLRDRTRTTVFNDDGALTQQTTRKGPTQTESIVDYNNDAAGVLRGYTVRVYNTGSSNSLRYTSTYTNTYRHGETYLETGQSVTSSGSGAPQNGSTARSYNVNGELVSFTDTRDTTRNRYFANHAGGAPLTVVMGNYSTTAAQNTAFQNALARRDNSVKAQHFFFANGQNVGSFGQLQDESGSFKANFDVNYTPVSDTYPSAVPAEVIVQGGDTLRTIAARVFGDAGLWYVLAEENGLANPDELLVEGTLLRVPNEVIALGNSATTFKPFDMTQALGDTTPTQPAPPPPKKKGCGVIGMILVIIVAIIVTIYTAGAAAGAMGATLTTGGTAGAVSAGGVGLFSSGVAVLTGGISGGALGAIGTAVVAGAIGGAVGSIASQGVAIAAGLQDKFSWKAVAMGAIGGGVGAGLANATGFTSLVANLSNGNQYVGAAIGAVANNALTQGIGVALGLQDKFDWRSVAITAVAAPLAMWASNTAGAMAAGGAEEFQRIMDSGRYTWSRFVADAAGSLASTAVRVAFGGKVDVATVVADIFGNALANAIVARAKFIERAWVNFRRERAVLASREAMIEDLTGGDPSRREAAEAWLDSTQGQEAIEVLERRVQMGRPFELLSPEEQVQSMRGMMMTGRMSAPPPEAIDDDGVTEIVVPSAGDGEFMLHESITVTGMRPDEDPRPQRVQALDAAAGVIDVGARGVESFVNYVGPEAATGIIIGGSVLLTGPYKTAQGLLFDQVTETPRRIATEWLTDQLSTHVFDFDGANPQSVQTVSHTVATVGVEVVFGGIDDAANAIVTGAKRYVPAANALQAQARNAMPYPFRRIGGVTVIMNRRGIYYPSIPDPRTGRPVPFPTGEVQRVPFWQRVRFGRPERNAFIAEWRRRGYPEPAHGWSNYDIHHIRPQEFGGSNDFWNLVPVLRQNRNVFDSGRHVRSPHAAFSKFWRGY